MFDGYANRPKFTRAFWFATVKPQPVQTKLVDDADDVSHAARALTIDLWQSISTEPSSITGT
jgi:hypothetical protein